MLHPHPVSPPSSFYISNHYLLFLKLDHEKKFNHTLYAMDIKMLKCYTARVLPFSGVHRLCFSIFKAVLK